MKEILYIIAEIEKFGSNRKEKATLTKGYKNWLPDGALYEIEKLEEVERGVILLTYRRVGFGNIIKVKTIIEFYTIIYKEL